MIDPRMKSLARAVVTYSLNVQPGEKVLIDALDVKDMGAVSAFVEEVHRAGGLAFVEITDYSVLRKLQIGGTDAQFEAEASYKLARMKDMDAVVHVLGEENVAEYADIPAERRNAYQRAMRPVKDETHRKRWTLFNYPSKAYAQLAGMSTEAYTDFLFKTCTMDYRSMSEAMKPLAALMERTDRVRVVAPGTDLSFSIRGLPGIACDGKVNLPDGEVFTAPVRDSVNGTVLFNAPTSYRGHTFNRLSLTFRGGRIVEASSDNDAKLFDILDVDEGARYVGEFAIGVNPYVDRIMNDVGFDEKISGSVHFALGNAYEECDNGNRSMIHWDIVLLLRPEHGGGEIYFDDALIGKDGRFVVDELLALNPERLMGAET
ncbi:aminopeptidase [Paenibacillus antri]|uniref:Aminopeptidase n=1 Tax=Paenibacillus antri TaxID=2582848 RepID=A0A5R9GDZ9_9BACL|nr:aminopeptidase [Paenibacillus antri]TLS49605.1 aminopeptidase [Paenibacillus antri]